MSVKLDDVTRDFKSARAVTDGPGASGLIKARKCMVVQIMYYLYN